MQNSNVYINDPRKTYRPIQKLHKKKKKRVTILQIHTHRKRCICNTARQGRDGGQLPLKEDKTNLHIATAFYHNQRAPVVALL